MHFQFLINKFLIFAISNLIEILKKFINIFQILSSNIFSVPSHLHTLPYEMDQNLKMSQLSHPPSMYISKKTCQFQNLHKKRKTEKMRAKTGQIRHCGKKCNFLLCKNIQGEKKSKKKKICANEEKFTLRQKRDSSSMHLLFRTKFYFLEQKMLQNRYFCNLNILINKNDEICSFIEEVC